MGFGKFVPLLSIELRRGSVFGESVNVVLLVQWFGMYAGALIDESDQMGQCVTLIHGVITVDVSRRLSVAQKVLKSVVSGIFHAMIRSDGMLAFRSDIETKLFLSDSSSITLNTYQSPLVRLRLHLQP